MNFQISGHYTILTSLELITKSVATSARRTCKLLPTPLLTADFHRQTQKNVDRHACEQTPRRRRVEIDRYCQANKYLTINDLAADKSASEQAVRRLKSEII